MTKEHCCSVRARRTMFLKLSVRFSSLLWAEITCQNEQQGYSSTVEIRQLFFNSWSGFSFGKGTTGRNTLNQYSPSLPAALTKSLSLKGAAQFSMRKKALMLLPSIVIILCTNFLSSGLSAERQKCTRVNLGQEFNEQWVAQQSVYLLQTYESLSHSFWGLNFNSQESGKQMYPCFNSVSLTIEINLSLDTLNLNAKTINHGPDRKQTLLFHFPPTFLHFTILFSPQSHLFFSILLSCK